MNSLKAGGRSEISKAGSGSGGFMIVKALKVEAGHPERSEAESKDPVASRLGFITGFLDFARNDMLLQPFNTPLLQVFCQHQLRAAPFVYVIDLVKGIANEIQTKATWLNHIMRAALHFMGNHLFAVVA